MIAEQFATERQVNIIETERRFIVSILAIGLAASWLVSQASGQMVPTANVNDSARGILQRYADNISEPSPFGRGAGRSQFRLYPPAASLDKQKPPVHGSLKSPARFAAYSVPADD
jgi:hypothetical protein